MEIKCERCGQKEGQIKKRQNKSRKPKIYVQPLRKNIYSRKKREDVSGRAKRPCNRTIYKWNSKKQQTERFFDNIFAAF